MCSESLLTFIEFFWKGARYKSWKTGRYEPGQYQPLKGDFKPDFTEKIRFYWRFRWYIFDPSTLNANQLSISLLFAWTQFWFFDEQIGKNQDKSINETSVSSISTN